MFIVIEGFNYSNQPLTPCGVITSFIVDKLKQLNVGNMLQRISRKELSYKENN